MNSIADLVDKVRSGVIHIEYSADDDVRLASGTGFMCRNLLVTNNHVYQAQGNPRVTLAWQPNSDASSRQEISMSYEEFKNYFQSGSPENDADFAILNIPQLNEKALYQFDVASRACCRIGDEIALLGFPFEQRHLACHMGRISSLYKRNGVEVIQLDASVNPSNSGGPLIEPVEGRVIGIVTRKATGLTRAFDELETILTQNVSRISALIAPEAREPRVSGISLGNAVLDSQKQLLRLAQEIRRSANVGIGYAFAIDHLLMDLPESQDDRRPLIEYYTEVLNH
ncbi:MAG: hypothetical protein PPHEMADM_4529 [uncultured Paraburkholderia sp.]|nr:MAG: hypothetical protein PPHEMADE_4534 [uncultured Paraburkholderia sp.]CAH2938813.1 MAG: hypothetical protein PPHEMADM_4529 [uncultured Paraburkholderia sp.]